MSLPVDTHLVAPLGQEDVEIRRLAEVGFDGAFTFEGLARRVLPPRRSGARPAPACDLMTNVAIALVRSPLTLAYSAWDLQTMSGGTLQARSRQPDQDPRRAPIRREVGIAGRADARVGRGDPRDLQRVAEPGEARLPRDVHLPHLDDAVLRPRAQRVRSAADPARRTRAEDDADGRPRWRTGS